MFQALVAFGRLLHMLDEMNTKEKELTTKVEHF